MAQWWLDTEHMLATGASLNAYGSQIENMSQISGSQLTGLSGPLISLLGADLAVVRRRVRMAGRACINVGQKLAADAAEEERQREAERMFKLDLGH